MKYIDADPFSNGTEYMSWYARNCECCYKSSRLKKEGDYYDEYTKSRCAIERDIFTRMVSDKSPIAKRTIDICRMQDCPYRKERQKRYEKDKGLPKLFEA